MKRCYESADISWFRLFWSPNHSKCSATHSPNRSYTEAYMQGYNWNAPWYFNAQLSTHTLTEQLSESNLGFSFFPTKTLTCRQGDPGIEPPIYPLMDFLFSWAGATRIQAGSCRNKRGRAQITFLLTASKRWRAALGTVWLHRGRNRQIIVVY